MLSITCYELVCIGATINWHGSYISTLFAYCCMWYFLWKFKFAHWLLCWLFKCITNGNIPIPPYMVMSGKNVVNFSSYEKKIFKVDSVGWRSQKQYVQNQTKWLPNSRLTLFRCGRIFNNLEGESAFWLSSIIMTTFVSDCFKRSAVHRPLNIVIILLRGTMQHFSTQTQTRRKRFSTSITQKYTTSLLLAMTQHYDTVQYSIV